MGIAYLMGLALLLGIKHSFDADHLVAVSTVLHRARSVFSALHVGASWAAGHMLTAAIITLLLFAFKESFLATVLPYFETLVGMMLILLGVFSMRDLLFRGDLHMHGIRKHTHAFFQKYAGEHHEHTYMFGVGVIHGLASNDELLTLFVVSLGITTFGGVLLGIGAFSVGVVLGMLAFCAAFSLPWIRVRSEKSHTVLSVGTGALSVVFGASILLGL